MHSERLARTYELLPQETGENKEKPDQLVIKYSIQSNITYLIIFLNL